MKSNKKMHYLIIGLILLVIIFFSGNIFLAIRTNFLALNVSNVLIHNTGELSIKKSDIKIPLFYDNNLKKSCIDNKNVLNACYILGHQALIKDDYKQAVTYFENSSKTRFIISNFWLGWSYLLLKDENMAIYIWLTDIDLGSKYPDILMINGYKEVGLHLANEILNKNATLETLIVTADKLFWIDSEKAMDTYRKILSIEPENLHAKLQYSRGLFHFEDNVSQAKVILYWLTNNNTLNIYDRLVAYRELGLINEHDGNYDEAIKWYKDALSLVGVSDIWSAADIARIYSSQGKFEKAIEYYSIVIEQSPTKNLYHINLLELYLKTHQCDLAQKEFFIIEALSDEDIEMSELFSKIQICK